MVDNSGASPRTGFQREIGVEWLAIAEAINRAAWRFDNKGTNEHEYGSRIEIELKDDGDPAEIVTKALADLQRSVDDRLKVIETKSVDAAKLTDRLDKLEAKLNRPANDNRRGER